MKLRVLVLVLLALPAFADEGTYLALEELPPEVRPFVEQGKRPLSLDGADLNGDGHQDFVLMLETQKAGPSDPDIEERQRSLLSFEYFQESIFTPQLMALSVVYGPARLVHIYGRKAFPSEFTDDTGLRMVSMWTLAARDSLPILSGWNRCCGEAQRTRS